MRKILTLILGVLLIASCSDDVSTISGNGSIALDITKSVLVDTKTMDTRSAGASFDLGEYTMTVNGTETAIPADGAIENLPTGPYTIELTNLASSGNYSPTFDDPRYSGSVEVMVLPDNITPAKIELRQVNAGVRFIFDSSLDELGLGGVTPQVEGGGSTLDYSADREAIGYFMPGGLKIRIYDGNEVVTIDGEDSMDVEVGSTQLWEVTLRGSISDNGSLQIAATVDVIEEATDERTWTVGKNYSVTTKIIGDGLAGKAVRLEFANRNSEIKSFDSNNEISLTSKADVILKKIVIMGGSDEIIIGRRVGNDIYFKYDTVTSSVVFRNPENGVIPIGIVGEVMMFNTDASTLQGSYKQEYDLFLNGLEWTPIGTSYATAFKGAYDGGGNKIHQLTIDKPTEDIKGYFGACDGAVISNITVASGSVTGRRYCAGVLARNIGAAAKVLNCVNHATVMADNYAGGVISQLLSGALAENCVNYGTVSSKVSEAGGVCYTATNSNLTNCANYGTVTGRASNGGVCCSTMGYCTLSNCHNYGRVEGNSSVGGVTAALGNNSTMKNCTNEGVIAVQTSDGGGITGILGGATIRDCENKGIIQGTGTSTVRLGGIVGSTTGGMIQGYVYTSTNSAEAQIRNGYSRIGGIVGYLNQATVQECVNYSNISGDKECVGGIVGENRGALLWCTNYGTISGLNFIGGLCGYNYQTGIIRMSDNEGKVDGATFTGGIVGTNWGSCSASINKGLVIGSEEFTGGVAGCAVNNTCYVVACYNKATVRGVSKVGGVVGAMNMDGLVEACYSTGNISGKEHLGGVCGYAEDDVSKALNCYWTTYKGDGISNSVQEVYYFDDGTDAPSGVSTGWPEETLLNWGINPEGEKGMNGLWWRDLGTKGSATYPALWWE